MLPGRLDELPMSAAQRVACAATGVLDPIRLPPDPFDVLDQASDASAPTAESCAVARSLLISVGGTPELTAHVTSLASAPVDHLRTFAARRGCIICAPTFLEAVTCDEANLRRGWPLPSTAQREFKDLDARAGHVFGLYVEHLHALVFTPQAVPLNHERVTLHELGHALTVRGASQTAHLRADLQCDLPPRIERLMRNYAQDNDRAAVRERVLEALAEAYAFSVLGRFRELSPGLLQALQELLTYGELDPRPAT